MSNHKVRRFLSFYRKGADRPMGELAIEDFDLDVVRAHLKLGKDDPMYEVYPLDESFAEIFRLKSKHEFAFDKYDYFLECSRI